MHVVGSCRAEIVSQWVALLTMTAQRCRFLCTHLALTGHCATTLPYISLMREMMCLPQAG